MFVLEYWKKKSGKKEFNNLKNEVDSLLKNECSTHPNSYPLDIRTLMKCISNQMGDINNIDELDNVLIGFYNYFLCHSSLAGNQQFESCKIAPSEEAQGAVDVINARKFDINEVTGVPIITQLMTFAAETDNKVLLPPEKFTGEILPFLRALMNKRGIFARGCTLQFHFNKGAHTKWEVIDENAADKEEPSEIRP